MRGVRLVASGLTSLILLSALVSGAAWITRSSLREKEQEERQAEKRTVAVVTVARHDFEVVVPVVGKLDAVKSEPVNSEVAGKIVHLLPNGSRVKKGDVIMELDAPRMAREVRDYQSQYQAATQELAKQKEELAMGVERAKLSLEQAQKQLDQLKASQGMEMANEKGSHGFTTKELDLTRERYERKKRQVAEKLLPAHDLETSEADIKSREFGLTRDEKSLQLKEAQQKSALLDKEVAVQKAQSDLKRAEDAQRDEIKNLEVRVQTTQQQLKRSQEQFAKATIRAPSPGIIVFGGRGRFGRGQEMAAGDMVYPQQKVATIPDLSKMQVALELSQEQMRKVKRKLKARVAVDSAPGRVFEGEVTDISQTAQEQIAGGFMSTGDRVFLTNVLLKNTKGIYLRPGTTSVATIIIERIPKAITLPLECVFDRDNQKIVYVQQHDGDFRVREIELGPQNDDVVVVKKGLKVGDRVALHDTKSLGEGPAGTGGGSSSPF